MRLTALVPLTLALFSEGCADNGALRKGHRALTEWLVPMGTSKVILCIGGSCCLNGELSVWESVPVSGSAPVSGACANPVSNGATLTNCQDAAGCKLSCDVTCSLVTPSYMSSGDGGSVVVARPPNPSPADPDPVDVAPAVQAPPTDMDLEDQAPPPTDPAPADQTPPADPAPSTPKPSPQETGADNVKVDIKVNVATKTPIHAPTRKPSLPDPKTSTNSPVQAPSRTPSLQQTVPLSYYPGFLQVVENGLLLSEGLTATIVAEAGANVTYANGEASEIAFHIDPDFGGTFEDPRSNNAGGWIYVSNSEETGSGGVGALTFDKDGNIIDYRMILTGTDRNCGGGKTPWGSWISCEEIEDGRIWQVDPTGFREPGVITLGSDGGKFESFAYDLYSEGGPQFFVTEDQEWGALQRFRPDYEADWELDPWKVLHGPGITDFLMLHPWNGTYTWTSDREAAMESAESYYPNSEGIDVVPPQLFFVSKQSKSLFILNLRDGTYTNHTTDNGAFDGEPDQVARILSSNDLLFFTEDGGDRSGINARSAQGLYFTILEGLDIDRDESTGLAFSPDGMHMYFAMQGAGLVYDVTRTDGRPFHAKALNIKYHAIENEQD